MHNIGKLTAVKLRILLVASIIFLTVFGGVGFWLFRHQLATYADQVNTDVAKAEASNEDIAKLQRLQTNITDNQVAITRAEKIVADSHYYQYQDQIINDIANYANAAGIKIAGFSFDGGTVGTTGTATTTPAAGSATTTTPAGLKSTTATITLAPGKNGYQFQAIMNFLKSIEQNLTKMNLSGVSLQKNTGGTGSDVVPGPITIGVYTR